MFFERITKFSLFLKKEKNSSSSEITLVLPGSTSRKETFFSEVFWGTAHSGGFHPAPDPAGISISSLHFIPRTWMQSESLSAQDLWRKGETNGNWYQRISCHGRMRMFTLWGQHIAQQDWSQHPPHTPAGNLDSVPASLTEQCFPETVRVKSQTSFPRLLKGQSTNVNSSLHHNDPSQASIHWQIMLYDITRVYIYSLSFWTATHTDLSIPQMLSQSLWLKISSFAVLELLYMSSVLQHRSCIILFSTKERQFQGPVPSKSSYK